MHSVEAKLLFGVILTRYGSENRTLLQQSYPIKFLTALLAFQAAQESITVMENNFKHACYKV